MNLPIKREVGIFEVHDALHAFIDDRLIYLRNSECSRNIYLFFGNREIRNTSQKFLKTHGFNLSECNNHLEVEFPDSTKQSDTKHFFFVNTQYDQSEILKTAEELLNKRSESIKNMVIYLLNSDSYFGHYNQGKDDENSSFIGSPATPAKLKNWDARPF